MVSFRAIVLFLLIMVERVFIIVLRGNICMFLKRDMNFLEMRAISVFHIFEFIVYFFAWMGGKFCLQHWKKTMFVQLLMFSAGMGLVGWGTVYLHTEDTWMNRLLYIGAFCLVGMGHGIQLATTLKAFDTDIIKTQTYLNHFFWLYLTSDVCGFIGLTYLDDYMILIYTGAGVILAQFIVLLFFLTDKTDFDTYSDPFLEWRVYIDSWFQHLVVYANENIDTRKTFKETRKERKLRMIKELLMKRKKLLMEKAGPKVHFLDIVIPKYGLDYINDCKSKWRLQALFCFLPLVWIGIEMQFSYWMLSVYRMDREDFLKPPQLILAASGVLNFFFIPIFYLLINSILKYAKFNTGMHRMVIGGAFIVLAVFIALNNINTQETNKQKANEPYFSQVKLMVINGVNCNLSFNEKVHVEYQQSYDVKTSGPSFKQIWRNVSIKRRRYRRQTTDQTHLRTYDDYYESYDLDAFVFEWNWSTFFDMVIYYVDPKAVGQMLTVFPYDCKERAPFDFQLDVSNSSMEIKGKSQYDIVFIAPPDPAKPRIMRVHHQREDEARPGLRFLIGNETRVDKFKIYRGDALIYDFPGLHGLTTDFYWFQDKDGPNLQFVLDNAVFKNKFVYRKGGLYNIVFVANRGKPIHVMNIYFAEPPFTINYLWALPQFVLMAIGELMFGMMGCEFFVQQTPQRFKYHTMLDWYWALAFSNFTILMVIHSGLMITFFFQVYWLSIMVLVSFVFFFYFTFRFPFLYLRPGEVYEPPLVDRGALEVAAPAEMAEQLAPMEVTVASDAPAPTAEDEPPPEQTQLTAELTVAE